MQKLQIAIALDDCIRNVSSVKLELENITDQEWLDYKSLIAPHIKAEDKINEWYDSGHDIHIIANKDQYNKQWLKNHYIPYNSIIDEVDFHNNMKINYWIDSSIYRCFNVCSNLCKIFLINENIEEENISKECTILGFSYPFPENIIFTSWNKVFIND